MCTRGRPWINTHSPKGVILSEPNGLLEQFKTDYADRLPGWYAQFDQVIPDRSRRITDRVQVRLHEVCSSAEQVQALMIYLVEECNFHLRSVLEEIKRPYFPIGVALCRQGSLAKA